MCKNTRRNVKFNTRYSSRVETNRADDDLTNEGGRRAINIIFYDCVFARARAIARFVKSNELKSSVRAFCPRVLALPSLIFFSSIFLPSALFHHTPAIPRHELSLFGNQSRISLYAPSGEEPRGIRAAIGGEEGAVQLRSCIIAMCGVAGNNKKKLKKKVKKKGRKTKEDSSRVYARA